MGKRGPARTPAHILRARGSNITKYASQTTDGDTRENELELPFSVPRMPVGLPEYAKREWKYLCKRLSKSQIINEIDGRTLERYVRETSRLRDLEKSYDADQRAGARDERLIGLIHKSSARCDAMGKLFGLSPVDRTRIQVEKPPEEPVKRPKPKREGLLQFHAKGEAVAK